MLLRATKRFKDGKVHDYWSMVLFPEDRAPETDDGRVVRIRMDRLTVRNVRNWGEVWLAICRMPNYEKKMIVEKQGGEAKAVYGDGLT